MPDELAIQAQRRLIEALVAADLSARVRVNQLQEIVFETDAGGRLVFLNDAWQRILDYPVAECLGHALGEFVVEGDRGVWVALQHSPHPAGNASAHTELRLLSRGGAAVVFETVVSRLDRGGVLGSLHDISARKRAEVEWGEAQRRYRAILFDWSSRPRRTRCCWSMQTV
jgi:PAS domain S-box-containing protein